MRILALLVTLAALANAQTKPYHLETRPGMASCFSVHVMDADSAEVTLPDEVTDALSCPSMADLSPNDEFLVYSGDENVMLYFFGAEEPVVAAPIPEGMWDVSGATWFGNKRFAYVGVDQSKEPHTTVFVVDVEGEKATRVIQKETPVYYVCASSCYSTPDEDFYFETHDLMGIRKPGMFDEEPEYYTLVVTPF
jgi:hypothetical protein